MNCFECINACMLCEFESIYKYQVTERGIQKPIWYKKPNYPTLKSNQHVSPIQGEIKSG